jgi:deoxyribodipyrimidine photo-lyase
MPKKRNVFHEEDDPRIQYLNDKPVKNGQMVVYWMQQSQRAEFNPALNHAIQLANHLQQPLLVVFGLTDAYPEANLRHFRFMLEGLRDASQALAAKGIQMIVRRGEPFRVALEFTAEASAFVCDRGYLRHQRQWRSRMAKHCDCCLIQVEGDAVIPVEVVSPKAEYAARTIRPKIQAQLEDWMAEPRKPRIRVPSLSLPFQGENLDNIPQLLGKLNIDRSVLPVDKFFKGGTSQAKKRFARFLNKQMGLYRQHRNQPQTDDISHMSMYLHFGQISPLYLALRAMKSSKAEPEDKEAYMEELIVRRELAINFVYYRHNDYDSYPCLPRWARESLAEHRQDPRQNTYSPQELEGAKTHDAYWNAAMREMKYTGFMHNYMRMYWGKKIIEWTPTPEEAYQNALALNNKYFLDGRDPNSYAGVGWVFGLHDRAWFQRPIFGKVRYMAASGLERKCDIQGYVHKVDQRVSAIASEGKRCHE